MLCTCMHVCVYVCKRLSAKMAHLLACSVKIAHLWTDSCILCYMCLRTCMLACVYVCVWLSAKMAHLLMCSVRQLHLVLYVCTYLCVAER